MPWAGVADAGSFLAASGAGRAMPCRSEVRKTGGLKLRREERSRERKKWEVFLGGG